MFWSSRRAMCSMLIITMLLGLALTIPAHAAGFWGPQQRLSAQGDDIVATDIAVDGNGTVHVVWSDGESIYHRTRSRTSWSDPQRIASGAAPKIAARLNGGIAMTFVVTVSAGEADVFYSRWHEGSGWNVPLNVSNTPDLSLTPSIAVHDDGRLAIAWSEQSLENTLIYVAASTDGAIWSVAPISNARGHHPAATWMGDALVVAWEDEFDLGFPMDIFVSQQQGAGWTLPVNVSASPFRASTLPTLTARDGTALLAWQEHVDSWHEIHMAHKSGTGWTVPARIADADAYSPAIASEAVGNWHLLWTTDNMIRHRRSVANNWLSIETVAAGLTMAGGPALAVDSNSRTVHAVWLAPDGAATTKDVWYSRHEMLDMQPRLMLPLVRW